MELLVSPFASGAKMNFLPGHSALKTIQNYWMVCVEKRLVIWQYYGLEHSCKFRVLQRVSTPGPIGPYLTQISIALCRPNCVREPKMHRKTQGCAMSTLSANSAMFFKRASISLSVPFSMFNALGSSSASLHILIPDAAILFSCSFL
jgi:hypothetical protein